MTIIKCTKDLYNNGKCFTKGMHYTTPTDVKTEAGLMEAQAENDQDEMHTIGSWWRHFKIVPNKGAAFQR